ncbi:MAG: hypothetical protein AAGC95_17290 [Pseudomonadota bacterium]
MKIVDVLLYGLLTVGVIVWWMRPLPNRHLILIIIASAAILLGLFGMLNDRWQAVATALFGVALLLPIVLAAIFGTTAQTDVPYLSGSAYAVFAVVAGSLLYFFPMTNLPTPSGPFIVGMRTFELTDQSRKGLFGVGKDDPRRLLIRVWYPAEKTGGRKPAPYFNAVEAKTTARGLSDIVGLGFLETYRRYAKTNSYIDAPIVSEEKTRPTVFFSHGAFGRLGQNTVLMEELASHGYIIYSVQHTGEAVGTVFPNGDVISWDPSVKLVMKTSKEGRGDYKDAIAKAIGSDSLDERLAGQIDWISRRQNDKERLFTSEEFWVQDRLFVHDTLQKGEAPTEVMDVIARSDFERTGQIGMSYGGMVTSSICAFDKRCVAGISLDGVALQSSIFAHEMPQAFMIFYADHDSYYKASLEKGFKYKGLKEKHWLHDFSYESFETSGQRQDIHRIELSKVAHAGFTDAALFTRRPVRDRSLGTAPTDVMLGAQNDFVRGFFDTYLRGEKVEFPQSQLDKYSEYTERRDTSHIREWWLSKSEEERADIHNQIEAIKN